MLQRLKDITQNWLHQKVNKPLLVIESDDWGAQRMPSKATYETLLQQQAISSKNLLDKVDTLESQVDVERLIEVLSQFKDTMGRHPVVTANFVTSNPDFESIKKDNFSTYKAESILDSYKKYDRPGTWGTIQSAVSQNFVSPEYHGREHVNTQEWMRLLQQGESTVRQAFDHNVYTADVSKLASTPRSNLMATFDVSIGEEKATYNQRIKTSFEEGLEQFTTLFNQRPSSFIAPCYVWPDYIMQLAYEQGISSMQGGLYQLDPVNKGNTYRKKLRYTGKQSKGKPLQLVRNVYLEPSSAPNIDWVGVALRKTQAAFSLRKPVIVCMHRVNFVGGNVPDNREKGLKTLSHYLTEVLKQWPEVTFLSSSELTAQLQSKG